MIKKTVFLLIVILFFSFSMGKSKCIKVGSSPEFIKISPDGKYGVISLYGEDKIAVFKIDSPEKIKKYPCGSKPLGLDFSIDGKYLFVVSSDAGVVNVLSTKDFKIISSLKCGDLPSNVLALKDGERIAVANYGSGKWGRVDFINLNVGNVVGSVKVGVKPLGLASDMLSRKIYVANSAENYISIIDTKNYEVTKKVIVGKNPSIIANGNNYKNLYITSTGDNKLVVFNILREKVIGKIICKGGPFGIDVIDNLIGVGCYYSNEIKFYDKSFNKGLLKTIPVHKNIVGVAFSNKTKKLYILSEGDDCMEVIPIKELLKEVSNEEKTE